MKFIKRANYIKYHEHYMNMIAFNKQTLDT